MTSLAKRMGLKYAERALEKFESGLDGLWAI